MSKFLKLDKALYNCDGVIPIKRGDDIKLSGQIISKESSVESAFDMTGKSATAYFRSVTGQNTGILTLTDAALGKFEVSQDQVETLNLETTDERIGESFYIIVDDAGKLETIETKDSPLEVLDRGYREI